MKMTLGAPPPKESFAEKILKRLPGAESWEDGEYMHDVRMATLRGAHPAAYLLLWAILAFVGIFVAWAAMAKIDEVTRGLGKVIPSSRVQVIQNLEGGIVQDILVQEGALVEKGQALVRLDDTGFSSSLAEKQTRYYSLLADVARLEAEISGKEPVFPKEVRENAPAIVDQAKAIYLTRKQEVNSTLNVLRQQVEQKQQELNELSKRLDQAKRSYALANEELKLTTPLERKGVVSKVELLRLKRQVNDLRGEMEAAEVSIPRARAALKEVQSRLDEGRLKIRTDAQKELAEKREEAQRLKEVSRAVQDQVDRTTVTTPMKGVVKRMLVNTVGGVIQPGREIAEIIPIEDNLLIEAQIRPQDIAFIRPGLEATVKITAYDYAIYGGLQATLEHISADTITNEDGDTFYTIRVRTDKNYIGSDENPLEIIPGMVASVDILTGKKTVLDYLLKPFRKASERALRER